LINNHFNNYKSIKIHRLFSNNTQTFAHVETRKDAKYYANMILFESGKTYKKHVAIQEVPKNQVGGITMFDGVKTLKQDSNIAQNKELISSFLNDVWIAGNINIVSDFFHEDKVIQHNPIVENNVEGLFNFIKLITDQGVTLQYQKVLASFAQGNMVMTYSKGLLAGEEHLFADLFRLENCKIIEHWDVIQKK